MILEIHKRLLFGNYFLFFSNFKIKNSYFFCIQAEQSPVTVSEMECQPHHDEDMTVEQVDSIKLCQEF